MFTWAHCKHTLIHRHSASSSALKLQTYRELCFNALLSSAAESPDMIATKKLWEMKRDQRYLMHLLLGATYNWDDIHPSSLNLSERKPLTATLFRCSTFGPTRLQWNIPSFGPFVHVMLYPTEDSLRIFFVRFAEVLTFLQQSVCLHSLKKLRLIACSIFFSIIN